MGKGGLRDKGKIAAGAREEQDHHRILKVRALENVWARRTEEKAPEEENHQARQPIQLHGHHSEDELL